MSRKFSLEELLKNLNVIDYNCSSDSSFEGTNINSEQIKPGNIFFAIKGNKVDGHDFIKSAFDHGAKLCIIDHLTPAIVENKFPYILVENVLQSLISLARYCRKNFKGKVIAVTGSAGKSTTKNWLFEILQNFKSAFSTYKNQNTDIGSALTLTNCDQNIDFCIMELGMSTRGEISTSSKIVQPDIAILTNVKPVHIENFHSLLDIAHEKADIVDGMKSDSAIFINKEETPFDEIVECIKAKGKDINIFSFGKDESCNWRLKTYEFSNEEFSVDASIFGEDVVFTMQNVGEHFIWNAVGILGVTKYLQLSLCDVAKKMKTLGLYSGAGQVIEVGKIKIIDETYNANPAAVVCAIKKLAMMEGKRKIAILGEMYELGDFLQQGLNEILKSLIENKIDIVFTCGPLMRNLFDRLPKEMSGGHCDDVDVKILDDFVINDGDVFLVKGSHGVNFSKGRMYEFVKDLSSYSY